VKLRRTNHPTGEGINPGRYPGREAGEDLRKIRNPAEGWLTLVPHQLSEAADTSEMTAKCFFGLLDGRSGASPGSSFEKYLHLYTTGAGEKSWLGRGCSEWRFIRIGEKHRDPSPGPGQEL